MLHILEEAARCLLCEDAPCGRKAARAIRALRFDNLWTAREVFNELTDEEIASAEKACIHYDRPIRIAELKRSLPSEPAVCDQKALPSLEINFCDIL